MENTRLVLGMSILLLFLPGNLKADSLAQDFIDSDSDGIEDVFEDELMRRFAPEVRLHPDDEYRPANINWFLPFVRMYFSGGCGSELMLDKGEVTSENLITQQAPLMVWDPNEEICTGPFGWISSGLSDNPNSFYLVIDDDIKDDVIKGSPQGDWTPYAHVRYAPSSHPYMYDIQYDFFYPYNGNMADIFDFAHEGDHEHVTVRVHSDGQRIHSVYFSAHDGEGQWYFEGPPGRGFSLNAEGRPIVYSAIDSHASYPWSGTWDRQWPIPNDHTAEGGPVWNCQINVVNVGEKIYPMPGMQWIQYNGRWGRIGDWDFTTGPHGPAYQAWWWEDDPKNDEGPHGDSDLTLQHRRLSGNSIFENYYSITGGPNLIIDNQADVIFHADDKIYLEKGFKTEPGAKFHGFIGEQIYSKLWNGSTKEEKR